MEVDYRSKHIRWVILFLCCWLLFGNYYAFDNPSSLNRQLMLWLDSSYTTYQYQFSALYSVYSIPNMILPLFTGKLIDKYGVPKLLLFFSALVVIGQGVFAFGVSIKSFFYMITGRIIFGLGGESLTVAQARLVTEWFKGKELALAIGLTLSVARFGTVFNNYLSPLYASYQGVPFAVWIGFWSCVWSFICAYATVIIDNNCKKYGQDPNYPSNKSPYSSNSDMYKNLYLDTKTFGISYQAYHPAFWFLCMISFTYYGAIIPFNNIASDLLQYKYYHNDPYTAGLVMSIPDTLSIFLVPILGSFVDKHGYKLIIMLFGGICMVLGHLNIASTSSKSPIFPLLLNGIANSTMLVITPCIPLLVPEIYWASAYGIMTVCGNASCSIIPLGVAIIISYDPTFYFVEIYFVVLTLLGTLLSLILIYWNHKEHLGLNESEDIKGTQMRGDTKLQFNPLPTSDPYLDRMSAYKELGAYSSISKNIIEMSENGFSV